ncbi:MAG: hypothetical protein WDA18_03585 [Candidatus Ratteibacteria bacterium]|jgi:hypothetical protein
MKGRVGIRWCMYALFFLLTLFLSANLSCADDFIDQTSPVANDWRPFSGSRKLGQIFLTGDNVSRITKIEIRALKKPGASIERVILSLYEWKENYQTTIATGSITKTFSSESTEKNWLQFTLDTNVKPKTPYYFELAVEGATGDEPPVKSGKNFYYVWEYHGGGGYLTLFNYSIQVIDGTLEPYSDLVFRTYSPIEHKTEEQITFGPAVKNSRVKDKERLSSLCISLGEVRAMMREGIPPIIRNTDILIIQGDVDTEQPELEKMTRYLHQYGIVVLFNAMVGSGFGDADLKRRMDPSILSDTSYQEALSRNIREFTKATKIDGIFFDEPSCGPYDAARSPVYLKPEVITLFREYLLKYAEKDRLAKLMKEEGVSDPASLNPPTIEEWKKGEKKELCYYFAKFRSHSLGEMMKISLDAASSVLPDAFNLINISPYSLWQGRLAGPPDLHEIFSYSSLSAVAFDCYEAYGSGESSIRPHDSYFYYSWGANLARYYGKHFFSVSAPHYNRARHSATWADALFSGLRAGTETNIWTWKWLLYDAWRKEMDLKYVDMSQRAFEHIRSLKKGERKSDFALLFPRNILYSGESTLGAFRYYGFGAFSRSSMEPFYDYDVLDSTFLKDPMALRGYKGLVVFGGLNSDDELVGLRKFLDTKGKFLYLVPDDGGIFGSTNQFGEKREGVYPLKDIVGCDLLFGGTSGPGTVVKSGLSTSGKKLDYLVRRTVRFHCTQPDDSLEIWVQNASKQPQFLYREYQGNKIFVDLTLRDPGLFKDALAYAGIKDEPLVVRKFEKSVILFNREKESKNVTLTLPLGNYTVATAFDGEFKSIKYPSIVARNEGTATTVQVTVPAQSHLFLTRQ